MSCGRGRQRRYVSEFKRLLVKVSVWRCRTVLFTARLVSGHDLRFVCSRRLRNAKRVLDRMSDLAGHLIVAEVVPKAGRLWHVHIHGVVVLSDGSDFLDYSQMIELCRRFEPEGVYASGQRVRSKIGHVSYIVGYISKPLFGRKRVAVFNGVNIDYSA